MDYLKYFPKNWTLERVPGGFKFFFTRLDSMAKEMGDTPMWQVIIPAIWWVLQTGRLFACQEEKIRRMRVRTFFEKFVPAITAGNQAECARKIDEYTRHKGERGRK